MAVNTQPLSDRVPIVMPDGAPTPQFQRLWQSLQDTAASGGVAPDTYVRKGQLSGWSSPSGTLSRATFATYTAPTASGSYSQSEMQAVMDALQAVSRTLAAVVVDLKTSELFTV